MNKYDISGGVYTWLDNIFIDKNLYNKTFFNKVDGHQKQKESLLSYPFIQSPDYCIGLIRESYYTNTCRLNPLNFTRVELYLSSHAFFRENTPYKSHINDPSDPILRQFVASIQNQVIEIMDTYVNGVSYALWNIRRRPGYEPSPERLARETPHHEGCSQVIDYTVGPEECSTLDEAVIKSKEKIGRKFFLGTHLELSRLNTKFTIVGPNQKPFRSVLLSYHWLDLNSYEKSKLFSMDKKIPGIRAIGIFNVTFVEDDITGYEKEISSIINHFVMQPNALHNRVNQIFGVRDI